MEQLINILKELMPHIDLENSVNLMDGGIIDSFDVINLIGEINDEFDIEIDADDILPKNFNSVKSIYLLITDKQKNR